MRRKGVCRTVSGMKQHNPCTCQGCNEVLDLTDLASWLHTSTHTLYKWASVGLLRVGDEDNLVAPVLFGSVHRIVGSGDEVIRVLIRDGHGDPDAER